MKAALALIVLYIGMFLIAIHSSSPVSVQAAAQAQSAKSVVTSSVDPTKDGDIRALLELVGARDQVQDSVRQIAEQYREKLLATVPNNDKGQAFVNTTINGYETRYDVDRVTEQLVTLYDKHYTDEERSRGCCNFSARRWARRSPPKARKYSAKSRKQPAPKPPRR